MVGNDGGTNEVEALLGALPLVVFATDASGVFTMCEGAGLAAMGLSRGEVDGRSAFEVYADNGPLVAALRCALAGEAVSDALTIGPRAFDVRIFPRRAHDGRVQALLGVLLDVTEREQAKARLAAADRMAALGALAGGIAHEVNNPLTYVLLNLGRASREIGRAGEGLPPTSREALARADRALGVVRDGVEKVARSVRDLRSFVRTDGSARTPLDLRPVLETAIALAGNEVRHRARLVREIDDVPLVAADEASLGQLFLNLLLQAARAIPDGDASSNEVRVSVRRAPGGVVVEVSDTGAPLVEARAFEPFAVTRADGVDAGLSLSVCHGVVSALGGTITAERRTPRGARFAVLLPVYEGRRSEPPRATTPPPSSSSRRARVLFVDDDEDVARAVSEHLINLAEVVCVTSGRAAIELLLRDQSFDLVLCDVMMPDIGGMDVFESVRRARPELEPRFAFVTGGAFTRRARGFLASVELPCLDKPLDLAALEALVHRAAARPRARLPESSWQAGRGRTIDAGVSGARGYHGVVLDERSRTRPESRWVDVVDDRRERDRELFDRIAYASALVRILRPRFTIAICPGTSSLKVERGASPWALLSIPEDASRAHIAEAVAKLAGRERDPYVMNVLLAARPA